MPGLLGLVLVAATACTTAELPPIRPPAHPWPAEPPTAETMRQLHTMLPQSPGDEPMSEADTAASVEAFLRARGGRLEPMWANHSHAERTANLRQHHASRRSERRRAQAMMGSDVFADATAEEKESSLVAVLDPPGSACDDPLATNTGQPTPCTYDCADLQREYFPAPGTTSARIAPPPATTSRNTRKLDSENTSDTSTIAISIRRSGLSDPYLSIASAYGKRGNGVSIDSSFAANIACISRSTAVKTTSWVTKDISMSIWVNSGCRSARRSSSLKHRAI